MLLRQIKILRIRINMVRQMQALGVFSFLCCVVTMYSVYLQWEYAHYIFAVSLLALLVSLVISFLEITQSTKALELELSDMEDLKDTNLLQELWSKNEDEPK